MGVRMPQDQPTQAVTPGKHCQPQPPTTAPQQGWEAPGVPMAGTVQRAVAKKEQGRTTLPRLLPLCSHTSWQSQCDPRIHRYSWLLAQTLLLPTQPQTVGRFPSRKDGTTQVHLSPWGSSHCFRMEKRRRLLTPFCPGTLESTSDSTTDSYVSLCVSREIWHTTFKGLGKQYLSWWGLI